MADHRIKELYNDSDHDEAEKTGKGYTDFASPVNEEERRDLASRIDKLGSGRAFSDELTEADRDFELHGIEDKEALKDEIAVEEEAALNPEEEKYLKQRSAINTLESFNERPEIDPAKDEDLLELQERVEVYLDTTSKENMVNKEYNVLNEDRIDDAMERLEDIDNACADYLDKSRPLFRPGRRRRALVDMLRDEVAELKDDREGLEKCYDDILIRFTPDIRDNDTSDGEDDDNSGKKNNKRAEEQLFVRTMEWPVRLVDDADTKRSDVTASGNKNVLPADKRYDETSLSYRTRQDLTMIRTIGLLFGITDWQQIADQEDVLYREEKQEKSDIEIDLGGFAMGSLSSEMTRDEGRRLAASLKTDPQALTLVHAVLSDGGRSIRKIARVTGVPIKILKARAKMLKQCLADAVIE